MHVTLAASHYHSGTRGLDILVESFQTVVFFVCFFLEMLTYQIVQLWNLIVVSAKQSVTVQGAALSREFFNRELYCPLQFSIQEQLLRSNEKQFRGGPVLKARRLLYHSTLGPK